MLYKPLAPGLARRMIEGVKDELGPLAEQRLSTIRGKPCPRCRSAMHPFVNPKYAFSPDDPLPRTLARCTECGLEWDPLSDIIISPGSASRIEDPYKINRDDPDD
jgi:hypothetical protein